MAKSKLKINTHILRQEDQAVEVWHEGVMIAAVYGADGPGVRVISKHPMDIVRGGITNIVPGGIEKNIKVIEVRVEPS